MAQDSKFQEYESYKKKEEKILENWKEKVQKKEEEVKDFIHKGIANRAFTRTFALGDYMEVTDAKIENGLLSINIERVLPDEKKPKTIKIRRKKPVA